MKKSIVIALLLFLVFGGAGIAQAEAKNEALIKACKHGSPQEVERLLEEGADVNARAKNDRSTPLMKPSWEGHLAVVKLLLDNGADVNGKLYQ